MRANEKLVAWRIEMKLSQRAAAKLAGLSQGAWSSYENDGTPTIGPAEKIEKVTDGRIKVVDWVESEEKRRVRQARKAAKTVRAASASTRRTGTDG